MNLTTTYMGLPLKNPLIVSASPLSRSLDTIRRMEDAGAAAVVMFSLFEEQLQPNPVPEAHASQPFGEAATYFPPEQDYLMGPEAYLDHLHRATQAVEIPVMGSLNGTTDEGWIEYARHFEAAGVAGIELNVYFTPTSTKQTAKKVEDRYLDILAAVKNAVAVPVAMKLYPFFSSMANMAQQLDDGGADALVLFNRFCQPDFDIESLDVRAELGLSTPQEIRLPLTWIAILYGRVRASLAATRGVHSGTEVIKYLLAGADAVMTTSALMRNGVDYLRTLLAETEQWMEKKAYGSVSELQGAMSQRSVSDPAAFERANYIKTLESAYHTTTT